jgi:hypothetical protein
MSERDESAKRLHALSGLLREGNVQAVVQVHGESMVPTLRSGRRVAAEFGTGLPRLGDLVVFRQADYLAVHRCLGTTRTAAGRIRLRTRGDGRTDCDGPVELERVLGKVVALERDDGWRAASGAAARAYAVCVALHDRCWALAGEVATRVDAALGRRFLRPAVEGADRLSLRLADTMFFRAAHRRVRAPASAGGNPEPPGASLLY